MKPVVVQTAGGEVALRRPSEAEVIELEEARRYMAAPTRGATVGRDDGTETILRCITNMTPDGARALLRKFPGLLKSRLVAAFRLAGGDDIAELGTDGEVLAGQTSVMRDDSAVTIDLRKLYGADAIGLRCFGAAVVMRPMPPERYQLMERLIAQDQLRWGVPFGEVARIGKEHVVSPAKEVLEPLLAEHPYLAINLGQLLMEYAGGTESDMLGKLLRYSPASTKSAGVARSETPASTSPPSTESAGKSAVAPLP